MTRPKPVALIVLDGLGMAPPGPGNAVELAETPNFDRYWQTCPRTELAASGRAVGLPKGQIGNSEVGHMNLGAGRVVMQSLTYIQELIESGKFLENDGLNGILDGPPERAVHLLGLVSRGGVHSSLEHLFVLLELCRRRSRGPAFVHAFTDGRDTAPDSGLGYLQELHDHIASLDGDIHIASVTGRYYAMDRDRRWDRTERAYQAVACGQAERFAADGVEAVQRAYARGETDEFIEPTVILKDSAPLGPIGQDDAVIFFNFRADRARQLTYALLGGDDWDAFERCRRPDIRYLSLMQYDASLDAHFAFSLPEIDRSLAQLLSEQGLRQYHTAETEKYAHVTYFFNAKREAPFPGEERTLIPSPKIATYDLKPEMSAPELTAATLARLRDHDDDFLLLNYANPDMVGHTGVLDAAIAACQTVDQGLGQLIEAITAEGGAAMILADHGNSESMIAPDGRPHTAHTTNPVPCILVGAGEVTLRSGGKLGDVAPTLLELMDLAQPEMMTGSSLIDSS